MRRTPALDIFDDQAEPIEVEAGHAAGVCARRKVMHQPGRALSHDTCNIVSPRFVEVIDKVAQNDLGRSRPEPLRDFVPTLHIGGVRTTPDHSR